MHSSPACPGRPPACWAGSGQPTLQDAEDQTSSVKGACQACVQHPVTPKFIILLLGIQGRWSLPRSLGMFKVHPFKESLDALQTVNAAPQLTFAAGYL